MVVCALPVGRPPLSPNDFHDADTVAISTDFAQHHIDSLDLNVNSVAFLAKMFPGKTEQEYRQHLGAFGITVGRSSRSNTGRC